MKTRTESQLYDVQRNTSSESSRGSESMDVFDDNELSVQEASVAEGSELISAEPVHCSTPLHLPCSLDFSLPHEASSLGGDSSSDNDFFLFDGSQTTMDSFEELIIEYAVRHRLPDNALKELLKILKQLLPKPNNVPNRDVFSFCHKSVPSHLKFLNILTLNPVPGRFHVPSWCFSAEKE